MHTQIGQIATALAKKGNKDDEERPWYKRAWDATATFLGVREGTPLQIKLNKFAYVLLFLAIICAIIVFGVAEFDINNEVILYAIALVSVSSPSRSLPCSPSPSAWVPSVWPRATSSFVVSTPSRRLVASPTFAVTRPAPSPR